MNYDLFLYLTYIFSAVAFVFLCLISWYYLAFWVISGRPVPKVPHSDNKTKFAILIAAREESNVIRNIFNSLKEQTYDKDYFDVWVIVEREDDPTVEVAKEFGYRYFVRDELTDDRRTKGFALQECIRFFKKEKYDYDSYMIFDADNVMDRNYLEVMNDLRQTGVKVGLGCRCFTNANTNWLTIGSAIMFSYMNQVTSRGRTILFHKATLMGTGYFVDADIIRDAGGWIFTGMTEDIQLTTYCYYHDVYMRYYPLVNFYDEQSPSFKTTHKQHLRWLFGYFERRTFLKKAGIKYDYHPKGMQSLMRFEFNCGLFPFGMFNVISLIMLVSCLVVGTISVYQRMGTLYYGLIFGLAAWQLFICYLVFVIPAAIVVHRDNKNLKLSAFGKVVAVLTYFFYFADFILAFLDGMFHPSKKTTWSKVEHSGEITDDDAKGVR